MTDESREPEIPPPRRRFGCLSWSLTIGGGVIVTVFGLTAFLYWLVYLEGRGLEMRVVNMTKDAVRIEKVLFGENELELRGDLTASDQSNTNWSRFIRASMNYEGAVPVGMTYSVSTTGKQYQFRSVVDTSPFSEGCYVSMKIRPSEVSITPCLELPWSPVPQ